MNYNYLNPPLFNYHTHFTLRRFCDAKFFQQQTAQNKQFWPTFCGVILPLQQFHHVAFQFIDWLTTVVMHDCTHTVCA